MTVNSLPWWGYLHINGSIQAKRVWGQGVGEDMAEARSSDFVVRVAGPINATSRTQAIAILKEKLL